MRFTLLVVLVWVCASLVEPIFTAPLFIPAVSNPLSLPITTPFGNIAQEFFVPFSGNFHDASIDLWLGGENGVGMNATAAVVDVKLILGGAIIASSDKITLSSMTVKKLSVRLLLGNAHFPIDEFYVVEVSCFSDQCLTKMNENTLVGSFSLDFEERPSNSLALNVYFNVGSACNVENGLFFNNDACSPVSFCVPGQYIATSNTNLTDRTCGSCDWPSYYSSDFNAIDCSTTTQCFPGIEYYSTYPTPTSSLLNFYICIYIVFSFFSLCSSLFKMECAKQHRHVQHLNLN
eukprot:m.45295 g.45295  ORF g.45295 m.45295 type:complete len:290 (+) comp7212_c0_seq2:60-929(+)